MYSTNRVVEFRSALKDVEKSLDERFIKCSNRCIINSDMLESVDRKENIIIMKTGQTVTVSTRYIRTLLKKYNRDILHN
jgi:DNA-binding LytR/AlgR family response regulator